MKILKLCIAIAFLWVSSSPLTAQENSALIVDSLKSRLHELSSSESLQAFNKLYTQIGRTYESIHNDSAIAWYKKQVQFLKSSRLPSVKKDSLIGSVYLDISYIYSIAYSTKEEVQLILHYADSAHAYFEKGQYREMAIRAYNNKGLALLNQNRFEDGIAVLQQAMAIAHNLEKGKKKYYALQNLYLNIGKGYIGLKQWPQAISRTRQSLEVFDVPRLQMIAHLNLSAIYLETGQADSALYFANRSYAMADSLEMDYEKLLSNINKAEAFINLQDYDRALRQIEANIELSRGFEYPYGISSGLNQKAEVLSRQGNYRAALSALETALPLSRKISEAEMLIDNLENLAEVHFKLSNYRKAFEYQRQFNSLKDSITNVENTANYNNLLLRYESSEKAQTIAKQDLELQTKAATIAIQKNRTWLISALALALVLGGLLGFFRFRHLQERRYNKALILEKENGLAAILSATEQERKRISKDLHDGIGQKLTALRLALLGITKKVADKSYRTELEQITSQFSESAEEVRQISHQMMPRALMENGLLQALEDLIENTFKFSDIKYQFEYNNVDKRYPEKIEISLYRIAQELLGNALKHSKATEIQVQLMEVQNRLILIVEDNGRGIAKGNSKGQGLYNINSRLDLVKGIVTYEPGPNTGMLATVNVPLS